MKVLQINTTVNSGSTGRIAEDIGKILIQKGHESIIAYGRGNMPSISRKIKIGNDFDVKCHVLKTRLFDLHGFGSIKSTRLFIKIIKQINPDVVHLHNIHGYYINIELLFNYLKEANKPVIWTFHDCWPFTGHCSYFDGVNCFKWKTECETCPNINGYPRSWVDNSRANFYRKKTIFSDMEKLTLITPSHWLSNHIKNSFLKNYPVKVIHNGVDLDIFKPNSSMDIFRYYRLQSDNFVLGVANIWSERKGLNDFIKLREILPNNILIVLVGLKKLQIKNLPKGIFGIARTDNIHQLASLYSSAKVFVNPTYVDNFPTTNIEALASGTPVVTYNTGGSPEAVDNNTGFVVEKGNIKMFSTAIKKIIFNEKHNYSQLCRERAQRLFNKETQFSQYIKVYLDQKLI